MKKILLMFSLLLAGGLCAASRDWAPAGDKIKTKWAGTVDPANVHPEYPRPQMVRTDWINLNGLWDYSVTDSDAEYSMADGKILVPFAIESSLSGVQKTVGKEKALWYERTFTVPSSWKGKDVLLHFGAVDWKTEVWVNGTKAGEHTGGYTPFSFDITPYLKRKGVQTLRVKVWDATDDSYQPRGKQVCQSSGIWYTPVTGIWQTVWLEPVSKTYINDYYVVSDIDNKEIQVSATVRNLHLGDVVQVELIEGGVGYSAEKPGNKVLAKADFKDGKATLAVPDMKFWSPDSPYLYGVRVSVLRDGKSIDAIEGYTAMRKISKIRSGNKGRNSNSYNRMALNNVPLFQFGPLDQGWWPDGLYTAPSDEALRFDIEQTKSWGFNMIRKHIKVEPARWYYWCDVLGMLVWQDMPCIGDHGGRSPHEYRGRDVLENTRNRWSSDSFIGGTDAAIPQEWKANFYKEWEEIMASVKNFQCICVWVPFNEAWGQFDTPEVVEFTRRLDPTRLINESSGGNYSFCGDILDVHHYACPAMNVFEGKMINVLGEYGGLGHVVDGHTWQQDKNWGYGKTLATPEEVLDMYEKFAEMLKEFIRTGCSAAVYTQTTDVEVEVNGIMTYDRIVKLDAERLRKINTGVIESMKD